MDKLLLQALKAIIANNGGKGEFSKNYLKYLDYYDIIITEKGDDVIEITTRMKEESPK